MIRSLDDYPQGEEEYSLKEVYLPNEEFEDLWAFVMENQEEQQSSERIFLLSSKGKKRQIKTKNFVGVVETSKNLSLEILPKIFHGSQDYETELYSTKEVFFHMLTKLRNSPFLSISKAHLRTKKNFPILEVFIKQFAEEVSGIIRTGIKSKYVTTEDTTSFIRGKLLVTQNIRLNNSNNSRFHCAFDEYSQNMAYNSLIKTALIKLNRSSQNHSNKSQLTKLNNYFDLVDVSKDIDADFLKVSANNRLYSNYNRCIGWAEIFLNRKSFTNFSGDSQNSSVLFPMERIFEDYVAYLFRKYSVSHRIKPQDKSYFLVESHKGAGKFRLKPDIVAQDTNTNDLIIIDTKWKILESGKVRKNYKITQADMYQLYAYGKKYSKQLGATCKEPKLVLLYPQTPNFNSALEPFVYEGDLELRVIPVNLEYILNNNESLGFEKLFKMIEGN